MASTPASPEEIQQGWHELLLRVGQLENERGALQEENRALRKLLERAIEHRQRSHSELVLLLTALVSKLPINDVGVIVSKLVEHNEHVSQVLGALVKGKPDEALPQPVVLQTLDQAKRDITAAIKPVIEELLRLEAPLDPEMLRALETKPELFFAPQYVRAHRCFIKGHVPRERVVRAFGEPALPLFQDMTTDPKLNPRPKPEEIALAFRPDFESVMAQNAGLLPEKRQPLQALYQKVQRSRSSAPEGRAQRETFNRLSFLIELLHYYEHQNTESPDVLFAQRLPALVEQLVLPTPDEPLDEKLIAGAEKLMAFIVNPDHRLMVINNLGKNNEPGKLLKSVLRLRLDKVSELDETIHVFVRLLLPTRGKAPEPQLVTPNLRLISGPMQRLVVRFIASSDRLRKKDAEALGKALAAELGIKDIDQETKTPENLPAEVERQLTWARIKDMIANRTDTNKIASTIRERLNAKYDAEEIRQSWITLTEADPIALIKIFCQLPYLANGKTDSIARTVLETYVTRLMHEKYALTYRKVVNSLRNMFRAKPDSPIVLNFLALVRWVDSEAADKISTQIGMAVAARA